MGEAQGTISPFFHPAAPALFLRGEQVQEFLVLVAVGFNSPMSLPAPALRRPQEICTLISQEAEKIVNGFIFQSTQLHPAGTWGSLQCSAPFWTRPQALLSKIPVGSKEGQQSCGWERCPLVHCSQPYPFVCAWVFLNKP